MRPIRGCHRRLAWLWLCCVLVVTRVPLVAAQATPAASDANASSANGDEYARVVQAAVEAYNRDDFSTARRYFSRAHELRPSARTWRGMGTTAFELKLYEDAVRELTFALEDTRSALPDNLRAETELTLRVARRHLAEDAASPKPDVAPASVARSGQDAGADGPEAAPTIATDTGLGGQRVAALVAGGLGVVAVGVGVGFGLRSLSKGRERDRLCPASEQALGCSAEAKRAADAAITSGNLSTVGWVVGGVGFASALVLWLTASEERPTSEPKVSLGPGTLTVAGRF